MTLHLGCQADDAVMKATSLLSTQELFDYVTLPTGLAVIQTAVMFTAFYLGKHSEQRPGRGPRSPRQETSRRFASKPRPNAFMHDLEVYQIAQGGRLPE